MFCVQTLCPQQNFTKMGLSLGENCHCIKSPTRVPVRVKHTSVVPCWLSVTQLMPVCWPTVGQMSVYCWLNVIWPVHPLSVNCQRHVPYEFGPFMCQRLSVNSLLRHSCSQLRNQTKSTRVRNPAATQANL